MEPPSTTNSNQIHLKTLTPPTTDHEHEHKHEHGPEPLIISCKVDIAPHQETNGCEKQLKNEPSSQRKEASKVIIPEKWGKENLLKDWMDYATFDELLAPKEAGSAREALVAEARREYI